MQNPLLQHLQLPVLTTNVSRFPLAARGFLLPSPAAGPFASVLDKSDLSAITRAPLFQARGLFESVHLNLALLYQAIALFESMHFLAQ